MSRGKKRTHIFNFYKNSLGNKKGLSAVVTTLLIILLALVAIGIVWVVVSSVIRGGAEQIELSQRCLSIDFTSLSVLPVSGQDGNYSVTLSRGSSGEIVDGVKITLFNSVENTGVLEFGDSLGPLDTKQRVVDAGILNANKIEITPYFLDSSGGEDLCPQTRSFAFSSSGTVIIGGDGDDGEGTGDPGTGFCGDEIIQNPNGEDPAINEECDGSNLGGQTCISLDFVSGTLSCDSGCQFDTSSCTGATPSSCNGTWDGSAEDTGVQCDGPLPNNGCSASCVCEDGFSQDFAGGCLLDPPLSTGLIYSIWPEGAAKYFDSEDLPVDVLDYPGNYINFTNSNENGCFLITFAEYLELNGRSYLRTSFIVNITVGDGYSVWEAENCGQ